MVTLLCSVRDCHQPLLREGPRLLCPRGHSFDVARSGYINLLQPQDRRSKQPGDMTAAVAARRRLHDRGVTAPLLSSIADMLAASPADIVLDAGCGDGFYLGTLARQTGFEAHGVDTDLLPEPSVPPDHDGKLELRDLNRALASLSPGQRTALILVSASGFSYEEAATICGCAVGTIKSRVARARETLLQMLDGTLPIPDCELDEDSTITTYATRRRTSAPRVNMRAPVGLAAATAS